MTRAELDRRKFLQMAAAAGAVTVFPDVEYSHAATGPQASGVVVRPVSLSVNGTAHQLQIDTRATLLDTLREQLQLFRHKKRLRPRPVRRLHGARQWTSRELLPHPGGHA